MNFDDSFFEDISTDKKEKKKEYPYSVRRQEARWFLSDSNISDNTRVIEQLKYKADYLYAQNKYTEAIKCYEELAEVILPSNTVLTQEVCESRIMCLTRLDETEQAEICLKQMVSQDKMNTNLWHLMFSIQREKKKLEKAVFAIQQCLNDHEEVASYWIDLAETFALLSTCFDWPNDLNTCYYQEENVELENLDQRLCHESNKNPVGLRQDGSLLWKMSSCSFSCNVEDTEIVDNELLKSKHATNQAQDDLQNTVEKPCDVEKLNKGLLQNEYAENRPKEDNKHVDSKDILNMRMLNCSIEETAMTHSEEGFSVGINILKNYAENHYYCYCALCSLVISRFLLHKYSSRSQFIKCEKRHENILKVNFLIKNITCASNEIVNETLKHSKTKTVQFLKSMKIT